MWNTDDSIAIFFLEPPSPPTINLSESETCLFVVMPPDNRHVLDIKVAANVTLEVFLNLPLAPDSQTKMKFVLFLAVLSFATFAACTNSTWGHPGPYDVLCGHTIRYQKSSFMRVVSENVTFPFPGQRNNRTITFIRVTDQIRKGRGYAKIYAGGIGYNSTTLHLKSEQGQGYNFAIEIFGR